MMKRYHDGFPAAPQALVAGIAQSCFIPSIIAARVGKDGSAYLDVFQNEDFSIDLNHLLSIAHFFEVEYDEVRIESGPRPETVTITVCSSGFDFSAQFEDERGPLPGEEDSEEGMEAHEALTHTRRN